MRPPLLVFGLVGAILEDWECGIFSCVMLQARGGCEF